MVTGHKYKIHWSTGIEFEKMNLDIAENWEMTDKPIELVFNHTEERVSINVTYEGTLMPNETGAFDETALSTGMNKHRWSDRELDLVITGNDHPANNPYKETHLKLEAIMPNEVVEVIVEKETESDFRLWSNTTNWPNNELPKEGDYVEIPSGWKMLLDIAETPIFTMVTINGELHFSDDLDVHLQAFHILVRAGELHIGNETKPHTRNALITLHGLKTEDFN